MRIESEYDFLTLNFADSLHFLAFVDTM